VDQDRKSESFGPGKQRQSTFKTMIFQEKQSAASKRCWTGGSWKGVEKGPSKYQKFKPIIKHWLKRRERWKERKQAGYLAQKMWKRGRLLN
jgi:hypothetical protein